ncbi:MarR family winged helix-turn-helix transcriptional regulator [Pigmentibacter ruber]|uniref:MarR family winged helix-turn-helix transcriptional regulator n=1 Tax=Pigmentibacter ruber TaxID=2683196 RepID=UPI00131E590E|nr:MarR family transcriptional regulator [Pigmentibacter ruber]
MEKLPHILFESPHFYIYKLSMLLRREFLTALKKYQLTPEKWQILTAVWENIQPVNQNCLARITSKDKPSISRLIIGMEKKGWIEREINPDDMRAYLIKATSKSFELKESIINDLFSHFNLLAENFGIEKINQLKKLSEEYISIIESLHKYNKI